MRLALTTVAAAVLMAPPALAKDAGYVGSVEVITGSAGGEMARGTVFNDTNRNSKLDPGEAGIAGVLVSNGREVVQTGSDGRYALPVYEDMNLFITKPAGYATPVNDRMVPQFHYIHKVEGSPDLRFGGIAPTGPMPEAVNFPLVEDGSASKTFSCLIFGDAQTYTNSEIGYVRETAGNMLAARDNSSTECLIFAGDVMGDDLSLYARFQRIIAVGGVPQYFVGGNHDLDFDAPSDAHSFDTFRREWGPEYYSFDAGDVHFVGLDNVRYPCNGVDDHPFCAEDARPSYNGVISGRQLEWLKNDLALVPEDKLIVLTAHIPFVTFTDNTAAKHQTDNLHDLYHIIGDRPALGLSGHTHTTENIEPGENFAGWAENTGTGPAAFHQIVTGALSGSWWAGDLNDQGVPEATQRLGSPRGYYQLDFDGAAYVDTYKTFHTSGSEQMHASFSTPRFRNWAERLFAYRDLYQSDWSQTPPVNLRDLGDMNLLSLVDLKGGTWLAVNVWNGSAKSTVTVSINGGAAVDGIRTQTGTGEDRNKGIEFADPLAIVKQAEVGRVAAQSIDGGSDTAGFTTWRGYEWKGKPGPYQRWMLSDSNHHLWRVDMPSELPLGAHTLTVETIDRHGRSFTKTMAFEVVDDLPDPNWQTRFWE
ncbi:MAG: calcineurin-like phosphoesterase family protein [Pseudomonadota bacterium]